MPLAPLHGMALFRLAVALLLGGISLQANAVWVRLMGLGPNRAEVRINQNPLRVMYPGESKDRKSHGLSGGMADAWHPSQSPISGRHASRFAEKLLELHPRHQARAFP